MSAKAEHAQDGGPREPTDWERAAATRVADLRMRLLDLKNSNRLLNFKFTERSRSHVRVIEASSDTIFANLVEGKRLTFRALPEKSDEPPDEKSDQFLMALEQARNSDFVYRGELDALDDDPDGEETRRIEWRLKDRVRAQLGLKPLADIKEMTLANFARLHSIDPQFDLPPVEKGEKQANGSLQVLMLPDQMERSLAGISDQARTALQEKGVNTLYVAFGYLEWYESESSGKPMFAPLLLHQIDIERKLVYSKYQHNIGSLGEETDTNETLSERLGCDFGLRLPPFEENDTPESYFSRLEKVIMSKPRWRVRRFVVVGHFAFARLVIYNDLNPKLWPGEVGIVGNSNILELFAGGDKGDKEESFSAEEYEVDNPTIASKVPLLITDADASQFSAIVDVMDGKNLALKGPPGTGKSQTITNIIAAALAKGRRVLFVADKMAALDVVKERLTDAGLGDFCFEIHSTKARKKDLLAALDARLEIQNKLQPPKKLEAAVAELEKHRLQLSDYVGLINTEFGAGGKTVHSILWAEQRSRHAGADLPKALDNVRLSNVDVLTEAEFTERQMKLAALGELNQAIVNVHGVVERHPWHGVGTTELNIFDQEELITHGERLKRALNDFSEAVLALVAELGTAIADDIATAEKLMAELDRLPPLAPEVDKHLLGAMADPMTRQALKDLLGCIVRWTEAKSKIEILGDPERMSARVTDLNMLAEAAERFKLTDETPATLVPLAEGLRIRAAEWRRATAHVKRLFEVFGFADYKLDLSNLPRIIAAGRHLAVLPRHLAAFRGSKLGDEAMGAPLKELGRKAMALRVFLAEDLQRFTFQLDDDPDVYRRHAASLRSARIFGFLYADVRAAKRAYRSMQRTHAKVQTNRMADDFDQLARALLETQAIDQDADLRELCGERFRGIQTPFDDLSVVHGWMIETKRLTSLTDDIDRQIREVLLEGTIETLNTILALAGDPAHPLLEPLMNELARSGGTIEDLIEWCDRRAKSAEIAGPLARKIGLFDSTLFACLPEAAKAAEVMSDAATGIISNQRAREVLGDGHQDAATDQRLLGNALNAAKAIENARLPEYLERHLFSASHDARIGRLHLLKAKLDAAATSTRLAWNTFKERAKVDDVVFYGAPFETVSAATMANRTALAIANQNGLSAWIEYRRAWQDCVNLGLDPLLGVFEGSPLLPEQLRTALDRVFYRSLARTALERHPKLARFSGMTQKQARERFRELDRQILKLHQQSLAAQLARASIDPGTLAPQKRDYTGLALIRNEFTKKQRHIPIRKLLDRAGRSIQQMKPCFMMSPLSVAQFLKPGGLRFDLLVIDEASQMRPEEALGSIVRADQTVIVGDPMQLPPTSFFDRADHFIGTDDEAEEIIDSESILDLALATYRPARDLQWHYRSRHESLIAFSNRKFYEDKLIVFPSPLDSDKAKREPQFGVFSHFVDGKYKSSLNLLEAQAVAEAAVAFMRDNPDRSLGVVTLNQPQRELLLGEIDRLVARDYRAAKYREKWEATLEPFFVKNLENVQGDERDVIFISTVYGPDADTGVVMNRFGPVNSNVGHRRLNVLFTRAKQRVDVFTSMRSGDIRIPDGASVGVKTLKSYLEYAETGRLEQGEVTGREPDSDFEIFVRDRLVQHGFEVVPQVGVAGYFIDLAVKHPKRSGYLLGIECDGATYHSSKSTRDRDRLREEVLIGLKWSIYRIWSTDWFANPEHEFMRLLAHIDQLIARTPSDLLKQ
jgi:very-short-patch-repair endonuclease